jgi:hypothetical protein
MNIILPSTHIFSRVLATCLAHLILPDLITLCCWEIWFLKLLIMQFSLVFLHLWSKCQFQNPILGTSSVHVASLLCDTKLSATCRIVVCILQSLFS